MCTARRQGEPHRERVCTSSATAIVSFKPAFLMIRHRRDQRKHGTSIAELPRKFLLSATITDRSARPVIDALPSGYRAIGKAPAQRAIAAAISCSGTNRRGPAVARQLLLPKPTSLPRAHRALLRYAPPVTPTVTGVYIQSSAGWVLARRPTAKWPWPASARRTGHPHGNHAKIACLHVGFRTRLSLAVGRGHRYS